MPQVDGHSLDLEELRQCEVGGQRAMTTEVVNCAQEKGLQGNIHSDGSEADLKLGWHRNKSIIDWTGIKVFQVNWRFQIKVL